MSWLRRLFGQKRPRGNAMLAYVENMTRSDRESRYHASDQFGR